MLNIPSGTKVGRTVLEWDSYLGVNLDCLYHAWPELACRNNEVAAYDGEEHDRSRLSRSSLSWATASGQFLINPTAAQLRALPEGSFAVVLPACSKPDPFGRQWGNKPMWLPLRYGRDYNAAAALLKLELRCPVAGEARLTSPLFAAAPGVPLGCNQVSRVLRAMLTHVVGPREALKYSPHSFRSFLATQLRACGRSHPDIQAVCRWLVPESVKIYAAMHSDMYSQCLDGAYNAVATSIHAADIPDVHGHEAALTLCADLHVDIEPCSLV